MVKLRLTACEVTRPEPDGHIITSRAAELTLWYLPRPALGTPMDVLRRQFGPILEPLIGSLNPGYYPTFFVTVDVNVEGRWVYLCYVHHNGLWSEFPGTHPNDPNGD